jgi:hypothetical protein
MANSTIGSSIGLTGTPREYTQLYKYSQQLQAAKQKAQQDKLDDIIRDVTIKSGENLHRLEVEPMRIRTAEFIDRARQSIGQDDMSSFYDELTNYQSDLNLAKSRSVGFNSLEKTVREAAAGNKYIPKNTRQAASLMLNSATSADYIGVLNEAGVRRNAFFDYDDQGNVMTQSFDSYDINKAAKDLIAGNSVIIGQGKSVRDKYTGAVVTPKIMGLPYDDEQAKELRSKMFLNADGTVSNPTLTAKQIPSILLKNTALAAQYIDQYDLEDKSPEEIEQHFLETIVKPNVKLKESAQVTKKAGDINIVNQQGTAGEYSFMGAPRSKLNFGGTDKNGEMIVNSIDSKYSVQLSVGGDLTFSFAPAGTMIDKESGEPFKLTGGGEMKANYVHVLPYQEINGVKYVISEPVAKQLYTNKGKKVPYAAFVEGKSLDYTVQPNVTNPDYYTEFTTDILGGFATNAAQKGKAVSQSFAKGISELNKILVSLGAKPVNYR